jgi:hypothetical protein
VFKLIRFEPTTLQGIAVYYRFHILFHITILTLLRYFEFAKTITRVWHP